MSHLYRSAVGTLAAMSFMWAAVPAATADDPDVGQTPSPGVEASAAPSPQAGPTDAPSVPPDPPVAPALQGWHIEGGVWYYGRN